jgi:hypothetical protein
LCHGGIATSKTMLELNFQLERDPELAKLIICSFRMFNNFKQIDKVSKRYKTLLYQDSVVTKLSQQEVFSSYL